jgi:hypothetical protein
MLPKTKNKQKMVKIASFMYMNFSTMRNFNKYLEFLFFISFLFLRWDLTMLVRLVPTNLLSLSSSCLSFLIVGTIGAYHLTKLEIKQQKKKTNAATSKSFEK